MKFIRYISVALAAVMALASCEKDGNVLTTGGGDDVVLDGNGGDIALDYEKVNALALTVHWNENGEISLNDPGVCAPDYAVTNVIQFAAEESFAATLDFEMENGVYERQFTVGELNNAVGRLGFEGGKPSPLHIRVKSVLGENIEPKYSNVLVVNITPYVIDMAFGICLTKDKEETGIKLYSAESNGVYVGFVGVSGWENWWMREGNGVVWGNLGVDGNTFKISSDASSWNMWYPAPAGCYWTTVDTQVGEWTALNIPVLTVSGDVEGDMTFDKATTTWSLTFENAAAGTKNVTIGGTGELYSNATGDGGPGISTPLGFGGTADNVTFGKTAAATPITVDVASVGTVTLKLNLSDPTKWVLNVEEGAVAPPVVVVNENLYLYGIDDGFGVDWNFNNYLLLYDEDRQAYGGAANINSLWGYQLCTEASWEDEYKYTMAGGDAMSGTLVKGAGTNIAAPEAGLYLMDVSLSALTYSLVKVESVYYYGLNDDWTPRIMTATATPGVYTADVEKTGDTPWGVKLQINLYSGDGGSEIWDYAFGGGDGKLIYKANGFDGDNDFANGTLVLTVNLCKGTYSYTAK